MTFTPDEKEEQKKKIEADSYVLM